MSQVRDHSIFYYHDGSIFIGKVLKESSQKTSLRLTTTDTISIHNDLVKRNHRNILFFPNGKFHFTKGLFYNTSFGGGGGAGGGITYVSMILGKHHDEHLDYGLGLSFHDNSVILTNGLNAWVNSQFLTPILYARYYPWSKKVRPFASFGLGYSLPVNQWPQRQNFTSGFYFEPSIGIKFASRTHGRYFIAIGQSIQRTKGALVNTDIFGNPVETNFKLWLNRTVFKVGVELW